MKRVSLRTNILVIMAVFLLGGLVVLCRLPPGGPEGVAVATTRGGSMLVLRLPLSKDYPQKQIIVFNNEPLPQPRIAIFETVESRDGEPYKKVQLTFEQWITIDNIREQWCINTPNFTLQQNAAFYDVGLRCQYSGFRSSKRVMVPIGELPNDLQELMHIFEFSNE
jgi:hypothetical protein